MKIQPKTCHIVFCVGLRYTPRIAVATGFRRIQPPLQLATMCKAGNIAVADGNNSETGQALTVLINSCQADGWKVLSTFLAASGRR